VDMYHETLYVLFSTMGKCLVHGVVQHTDLTKQAFLTKN